MWVQGGVSGIITPFRSYDARSGRWRSHDPIFQPWESTYLGMGGNPAMMVDPWGLKGTGLTYQKSAASPLSAAQYGTRGIPFFGSTPRSDQTNVAINYARDTQKTAPSQESRTSQALQKRQAERNSKKKNKKRKPRNNVEEFEAGVEAGFEGEINSGLDAVAVIPEMLTDATIEIANNSDLLLEIVLETGAGAALSLGEELLDVVNPIGYILDSPYENGQKFGSLMGKFVVALYTGGLAIIARVALQMPKLAKLATAARSARNELSTTISRQRQKRHVEGTEKEGGGYVNSIDDAQSVLDAVHSGKATYLGRSKQGHLVYRFDGVTGTNVNKRAGISAQPTNVFIIKGTTSPSVVPTNPNWKP